MAQKGVKVCGTTTRERLRSASKVDYRWSSFLVKEIIGIERRTYQVGLAEYKAMPEAGQTAWNTAADALHIPASTVRLCR